MLRLLQVPDCADALLKVVDFQRQLFHYAVEHDELYSEELLSLFDPETADWLWQQKTLLIDSLTNKGNDKRENFLKFDYELKNELYNSFCNDIEFYKKYDDVDFTFKLSNDCKEIKDWLIKFYDVLTDNIRGGFPPSITGLADTLNSAYWWESIYRANNQDTCPICDTLLIETDSIEHFLPKSKYPALSIHPFNLFPSCEKCNHKKGDKDPLLNMKYPYILHPYNHPLEDDSEIHFISNDKKDLVVLHPDCQTAQEFSRLFILPDRWNDKMHRFIIRCGMNSLRNVLSRYPNAKEIEKEQIISEGLDDIKRNWGKCNYAYVATRWITEIAPQKWDSILVAVSRK